MIGWLKRWEVAVQTHHGPMAESRHLFHGSAKAQALLRDQADAADCQPPPPETPRRRYARRRR